VADPEILMRGVRAAALVSQMAVITVLCGGLGWWLDGRYGTAPWLLAGGFIGGFALGLVPLFTTLLRPDPTDDDPTSDPAE
jgi:F0F1-type ATP synthase assembly protein I